MPPGRMLYIIWCCNLVSSNGFAFLFLFYIIGGFVNRWGFLSLRLETVLMAKLSVRSPGVFINIEKHIRRIKFSQTAEQEFSKELKRRIQLYFKLNKTNKRANTGMVLKTIAMFALYTAPIALISTGIIGSPLVVILLFLASGLGMAGIGMGVMHDANHGAYTQRRRAGAFLSHTLDYLGCSSEVWKLQHNVLHHTYTNISGHDEDIEAPLLLRFSPHGKHYKMHRYQHYYVWFFYGILTLYWVTAKDFVKSARYRKMGLIRTRKEYRVRQLKLIGIKVFYFSYALVLPLLFAPVSAGWVIGGFLLMHALAGMLLSVVFQLAHVMPGMDFPLPDESDQMHANWYTHQLQSTSNFSPKNRLLFWYLGGLTNQIEHHLFPNICHVHYRNIGKIVARTARDFDVPYHVNTTFVSAVRRHINMLRMLGRMESVPLNAA